VLGGVFILSGAAPKLEEASANTAVPPDALFNALGDMSRTQAIRLMGAIGDTPDDVLSMDRTAAFRLFPNLTFSYATTTSLARLYWRLVDVYYDRVTLWATGAYMASYVGLDCNSWDQSVINTALNADITRLMVRSPNLRHSIMTRRGLYEPSFQEFLPAFLEFANARLFLPTYAAIRDGGAWGLNDALRRFNSNGFGDDILGHGSVAVTNHTGFLGTSLFNVTADIITTDGRVHASQLIPTGGLNTDYWTDHPPYMVAVRPAITISLSSIQRAAAYAGDGENYVNTDSGASDNDTSDETDAAPWWAIPLGVFGAIAVVFIVFKVFKRGQ